MMCRANEGWGVCCEGSDLFYISNCGRGAVSGGGGGCGFLWWWCEGDGHGCRMCGSERCYPERTTGLGRQIKKGRYPCGDQGRVWDVGTFGGEGEAEVARSLVFAAMVRRNCHLKEQKQQNYRSAGSVVIHHARVVLSLRRSP